MLEAAGGVVWRESADRHIEVLLIHRPHRRDWSLPKGKRRRCESSVDCAVREVREETGLRCTVGHELPETRYADRKGRPKRVRYWSMHGHEGEFHPNAEVDEICWLRIEQVDELLTYRHDLVVVAGLQRILTSVG